MEKLGKRMENWVNEDCKTLQNVGKQRETQGSVGAHGKLANHLEKLGNRVEKLGKRVEKLGKCMLQNLVKPMEKQRKSNDSRSTHRGGPLGMHFWATRITQLLQKP